MRSIRVFWSAYEIPWKSRPILKNTQNQFARKRTNLIGRKKVSQSNPLIFRRLYKILGIEHQHEWQIPILRAKSSAFVMPPPALTQDSMAGMLDGDVYHLRRDSFDLNGTLNKTHTCGRGSLNRNFYPSIDMDRLCVHRRNFAVCSLMEGASDVITTHRPIL